MKFLRSVRYAMNGIWFCWKNEQNFRIEVIIAILVLAAGLVFKLTTIEWLIILLNIASVLCLEMINTAIEVLCDRITKEHDRKIKAIKDLGAGFTLLAAIAAAICGTVIFLPKIIDL